MKISISDGEILVDFTGSHFKDTEGNKEIVLSKKNFLIPVFKGIPKTYSYYNKNKVNPYYLNCSCKEYRDKIKLYPLRDIRRMCKHIFFILTKNYSNKLDEITRLLLEHQFWNKITEVYELEYRKEKLFLSFNKNLDFFYIYRKESEWKFYAFNSVQNTWDNNLPPFKDYESNRYLITFIGKLLYQE
ncbi:MAG: hypothetical protein WAV89_02130 [Ignavibacteriaceae bacterium]